MPIEMARLLIVDDDSENGKFLEQQLANEGCNAVWYKDPREALRLFQQLCAAGGAALAVHIEGLRIASVEHAIQRIRQHRLPRFAVQVAGSFLRIVIRRHGYITCFLLRPNSRASSARPRLMRLLTVPSGTRSTRAISL